MKTKTIIARFRYSDWKMLRKIVPAHKGESFADYMERVVIILDLNRSILNYGG